MIVQERKFLFIEQKKEIKKIFKIPCNSFFNEYINKVNFFKDTI